MQEGCQQVSSSLDGLPTFMRTLRRSPAARLWNFGLLVAQQSHAKSFPSHAQSFKSVCFFDYCINCINCVKAVPLSGHHSCTLGLELGTCWLLVVLGHEARGAIPAIPAVRAMDIMCKHLCKHLCKEYQWSFRDINVFEASFEVAMLGMLLCH